MSILKKYIILLFVISCTPKPEPLTYSDTYGIPLKVLVPAGDRFIKLPNAHIPTFFNLATIDEYKSSNTLFIILSERKSKGSVIYAKPVSLFNYVFDSIQRNYIICLPTNSDNHQIGQELNTFAIQNAHLQAGIENWFKEQCPSDVCRNFKWENTLKALIEIDKTLNELETQ